MTTNYELVIRINGPEPAWPSSNDTKRRINSWEYKNHAAGLPSSGTRSYCGLDREDEVVPRE